jgi:hypothetical protein
MLIWLEFLFHSLDLSNPFPKCMFTQKNFKIVSERKNKQNNDDENSNNSINISIVIVYLFVCLLL